MAIKQGIRLIGNFCMEFCLKFWNKKKKWLRHKGNKIASNFAASSVACDREFNFLSNYDSLRTLLKRNNEPSGWHCFFFLPYLFFFRWPSFECCWPSIGLQLTEISSSIICLLSRHEAVYAMMYFEMKRIDAIQVEKNDESFFYFEKLQEELNSTDVPIRFSDVLQFSRATFSLGLLFINNFNLTQGSIDKNQNLPS